MAARATAPLCRPASPTPASLAPTETAYDLFARLEWPGLPLLPFEAHDGGLKVGETLELLGEPSTGKTALLLESCARCILSAEHGGHGARAVIVETDGGFDVRRLAAALARKLEASAAAGVHQRQALRRAHDSKLRAMKHNLWLEVCGRLRPEVEPEEEADE